MGNNKSSTGRYHTAVYHNWESYPNGGSQWSTEDRRGWRCTALFYSTDRPKVVTGFILLTELLTVVLLFILFKVNNSNISKYFSVLHAKKLPKVFYFVLFWSKNHELLSLISKRDYYIAAVRTLCYLTLLLGYLWFENLLPNTW